ncbi:MAG: TetR/AcrR family transcriptional regulator [Gemmatimonadales bacterium]|nr:TetR/AcrR family transcriptional regulator [Gemmatimonadales bacterium]
MVARSSVSVPGPRWQRRPEARPDEILDAAQRVFGESGFAGTRLDVVAREAGVSKGTLYLYFDSKEALFREMIRARVVSGLADGEEVAARHQGTSSDLLIQLVTCMYGTMRQPSMVKISRLVHAELRNFPELAQFYYDEVILRSRRLLQEVLDSGVASGEFRRSAPAFAARGIPAMLVNTAQHQCLFGGLDPEALTDEQALAGVLDLCLNGVLDRPAAPR